MTEKTPAPLFLTEAELDAQGKTINWRSGKRDIANSIFRTPRSSSTGDIPSVFQNVVKHVGEAAKPVPFSYKANLKPLHIKPRIIIPLDEDPPYAPKTP
jgi:hypothetical protein